MTPTPDALDLDAYLRRIDYRGPRRATRAVLQALHEAQRTHIPFENADVRLGRPIRLDLAALQAKLVHGRRGGYCFEQNTLFAAALRALGFAPRTLEARVRPAGVAAPLPRTHMLLALDVGAQRWLADVGFGADGPLWPVPWSGALSVQPGGTYRVVREGALRVLRLRRHRTWEDLYAFGAEPVLPVDYALANHYTATHPDSRFVRVLTVQSASREARHLLRGRSYAVRRAAGEVVRELEPREVVALVRERFGLGLSSAEIQRALGDRS